jgi:CrcB protein
VRYLFAIGFLGSFTTFSTMSHETVELLGQGQMAAAVLNAAANGGLCIAAAWIGRALVRMAMVQAG